FWLGKIAGGNEFSERCGNYAGNCFVCVIGAKQLGRACAPQLLRSDMVVPRKSVPAASKPSTWIGAVFGRARRSVPRAKKASVWVLLCLPGVLSLMTDSWHRAGHLWSMPLRYQALYVLAAVESC